MSPQARILLVDDRMENLVALDAILSPLNQILVPVRSGEQALQALLTEEYAVVLLDIVMPGMNGRMLAERRAMRLGQRRGAVKPRLAVKTGAKGPPEQWAFAALRDRDVKPAQRTDA